ncbi:MAG TPA: helix-turn-helix domain-containing protein [Candidatus Acidoferrales bacterium]|nr:helix-turn-helix domain-containing protein [Candidatus Acidoferrales bacterium]
MHADRFFRTTRGKIVTELRRRGSASAADLAAVFALSPNAVRQQLVLLERDGLVVEKAVRRGPTKPTLEFSLTPEAGKLFPQGYDKMLTAVLREVRDQFGAPAVERIFDGLSKRAVERARRRINAPTPQAKVEQLTEMLRDSGVVAEFNLIDGGFELREHNCPYSEAVKEHPEMCHVIHHVIEDRIGGSYRQTESLANGGKECRFELKPPAAPVTS